MSYRQDVRVGVIGLGFGGRVVAPSFASTEGCTVVDVVSPRDDKAVAALCTRRDVDLISVDRVDAAQDHLAGCGATRRLRRRRRILRRRHCWRTWATALSNSLILRPERPVDPLRGHRHACPPSRQYSRLSTSRPRIHARRVGRIRSGCGRLCLGKNGSAFSSTS